MKPLLSLPVLAGSWGDPPPRLGTGWATRSRKTEKEEAARTATSSSPDNHQLLWAVTSCQQHRQPGETHPADSAALPPAAATWTLQDRRPARPGHLSGLLRGHLF